MGIRFLPHTADIKFRVYGKRLEDCFENSCLALTKIITRGKINSTKTIKIKIRGKDLENLLYNFLEKILDLFNSKKFLVSKIKVKIDKEKTLVAELTGEKLTNQKIEQEIKAITYNEMFVKKEDKWVCQVVVDV